MTSDAYELTLKLRIDPSQPADVELVEQEVEGAAPDFVPRNGGAEQRAPFGTRMKPSLHHFLKSEVLRIDGAIGRRVRVESVVEALVLEWQADPELQARVLERVRRE